MFRFLQHQSSSPEYVYSDYYYASNKLNKKNITYFDGTDTWNTILVHNISYDDDNHHEHLLITLLEQHVGKIKKIEDVYYHSLEMTIAITFEWWYKNDFTISLSDAMDKKIKLTNGKTIYNQVEIFYTERNGLDKQYSNLISAI